MRRWLSIAVGLLVLAAALVLYWLDPPVVQALNNMGHDALLSRIRKPVQSDAVLILDIDEKSLAERGQWPWPRSDMATLVKQLTDAGAAAIAFDIIFSEPDRIAIGLIKAGVASADFDLLFSESLKDSPTVLGCFLELSKAALPELPPEENSFYRGHIFEKGVSDHNRMLQSENLLSPLELLSRKAAGIAFVNTVPERDRIIRKTPLVIAYGPSRIYPALGLEALRIASRARLGVFYDTNGVEGIIDVHLQDRSSKLDLAIPTDENGRMVLNFRTTRFPRISATDLIEGRVDPEAIQGRIVFVGTSAAALGDLVATPYDHELPGVEVHATLVDNVLADDILVSPRWMGYVTLLGLLIGGIVVLLLTTATSALLSLPVIVFSCIGSVLLSVVALHAKHWVTPPVFPVLVWLVIYLAITIIKYWMEERARHRVRNMFGTMVSPSVLQYLETTPGSFSLRGHKAEASILFADLMGFTSISEQLPPEELSSLLNQFHGPMTRVVMDHDGYIDKLQGDAVMAEWGVPFAVEDHALSACHAALDQQQVLAEMRPVLKEAYGFELHMRTGINSGVVTAGNMGSEDPPRFQYTVLGDAVNQASRLEGATRIYGVKILIGESTAREVRDQLLLRQVDRVCFKGKSAPTDIYELIRKRTDDESIPLWISAYEEGLVRMQKRDFDKAEVAFRHVLDLCPDDPPALLMLDRLSLYRKSPPPGDWQGEFVLTTK